MTVDVVHLTDPGCPWAYSASPALAVLRWRFGDQLRWRLTTIGLAEDHLQYDARGYRAATFASSLLSYRRFGMPLAPVARPRMLATGRACRAIVATRLRHPGREDAVLRALQFAWFTSDRLMDQDDEIGHVLEAVAGIDVPALVAMLDGADVTEAYEADRAVARGAAGSPCEAMGRSETTDGPVRYTAPSLIFEAGGRRFDAGGFQALDAYDVCLANLAPELERRDPADTPEEALAAFPDGLTTQEVTAVMTPRLAAADRRRSETMLVQAAVAGRVRSQPLGGDALWTPA